MRWAACIFGGSSFGMSAYLQSHTTSQDTPDILTPASSSTLQVMYGPSLQEEVAVKKKKNIKKNLRRALQNCNNAHFVPQMKKKQKIKNTRTQIQLLPDENNTSCDSLTDVYELIRKVRCVFLLLEDLSTLTVVQTEVRTGPTANSPEKSQLANERPTPVIQHSNYLPDDR